MANRTENQFNISGRVIHVGMPETINDKFSKRTLVIEAHTDGKFKQEIPFEFVNASMNMLNEIREGDWANVEFSLSGRKKIIGGKAVWYGSNRGISCIKQ